MNLNLYRVPYLEQNSYIYGTQPPLLQQEKENFTFFTESKPFKDYQENSKISKELQQRSPFTTFNPTAAASNNHSEFSTFAKIPKHQNENLLNKVENDFRVQENNWRSSENNQKAENYGKSLFLAKVQEQVQNRNEWHDPNFALPSFRTETRSVKFADEAPEVFKGSLLDELEHSQHTVVVNRSSPKSSFNRNEKFEPKFQNCYEGRVRASHEPVRPEKSSEMSFYSDEPYMESVKHRKIQKKAKNFDEMLERLDYVPKKFEKSCEASLYSEDSYTKNLKQKKFQPKTQNVDEILESLYKYPKKKEKSIETSLYSNDSYIEHQKNRNERSQKDSHKKKLSKHSEKSFEASEYSIESPMPVARKSSHQTPKKTTFSTKAQSLPRSSNRPSIKNLPKSKNQRSVCTSKERTTTEKEVFVEVMMKVLKNHAKNCKVLRNEIDKVKFSNFFNL